MKTTPEQQITKSTYSIVQKYGSQVRIYVCQDGNEVLGESLILAEPYSNRQIESGARYVLEDPAYENDKHLTGLFKILNKPDNILCGDYDDRVIIADIRSNGLIITRLDDYDLSLVSEGERFGEMFRIAKAYLSQTH